METNPTPKSIDIDDPGPVIDQLNIEPASEFQEEESEDLTPHTNNIEIADANPVEESETQRTLEPQPDTPTNKDESRELAENDPEPITEKDDGIIQVDAIASAPAISKEGPRAITRDLREPDQTSTEPLPRPRFVAKSHIVKISTPTEIKEDTPGKKDVLVFDRSLLPTESSSQSNTSPGTNSSENRPKADLTANIVHNLDAPQLDRVEVTQPLIGENQESGSQPYTEKPPVISTTQLKIESINMLFSADSHDDLKKGDGIVRAVVNNGEIIIGIAKKDSKGEYKSDTVNGDMAENANTPDLAPVSTITQLNEVISYISILASEDQFNDKDSTENNLEGNEQKRETVTVIITDEILDFIQLLNEDSDPDSEDINSEGLSKRNIRFTTEGENPKQVIINHEQILQMQEILVLLNDPSFEEIIIQTPSEENDLIIDSKEINGEFTLGTQRPQSESETREVTSDEISPITSIGQLAETLDLIDKLILDIGANGSSDSGDNSEVNMNLPHFGDEFGNGNEYTIIDFKIHSEDEASQFTILVSDELISFIESSSRILEKKGKNKVGNFQTNNFIHNANEGTLIRISSTDRDILIELTTLKKLIKLIEMKKKMDSASSIKEDLPAPEELDNFNRPGQSAQYNSAFWFVFQTVLNLLSSTEDNDLSLFYNLGPSLSPSAVLHV